MLKFFLLRAQHRMKIQGNKHKAEREFAVEEWLWLKLQPYGQQSLQFRVNQKLAPKFYGPFQIEAKVGKVAYRLKLPSTAQIHHTFHVSQLKLFRGMLPAYLHIPGWLQGKDAKVVVKPVAILDRMMVKKREIRLQSNS